MKKFILKQILTVAFLISPAALMACTPDEQKAHSELIHHLIKNTADFAEFSIAWTTDFFDTNNHTPFASFTHQFTQATNKFNEIVIKPLTELAPHSLRHSPYHHALSIGKDIACTLHKQADHVCAILNKNLKNRNATFVGLALLETKKYTSSDMIKELEKKFDKFSQELRKVDPEIATYAHEIGRNLIQSRKFQHDMSMNEQRKALSHRVKC